MKDPLSDIIHAASITGGVFLESELTAPWAIYSQITPEDCATFLDIPAHVIAYHVVTEGRLFLQMNATAPIEVNAGEIILLPRNCKHVLASSPGISPADADEFILPDGGGKLARLNYGGGGETTKMYCGYLASEFAQNPLIMTLPDVIKLDIAQDTAKDWIETSVQFAAVQLSKGQLASSAMMSRLSELLFVEAIRNYSENQQATMSGWIRGLSDKKIGQALTLIHTQLDKSWTLTELASEVAMSRSAFIERFTSLVSTPPIRYLTVFRLSSAKALLRESNPTIAEIAHLVGYESAVAFNRAFKREFGVPPARWRSNQMNQVTDLD